uniref:Uncharacterized protein n=1 Tax=Myotis myotis TaxID=51298 RepID=A0A7J7T6J3_MYOMY|nr:hypothetical protein mMyoMyo1_009155 [Myotis myotis]
MVLSRCAGEGESCGVYRGMKCSRVSRLRHEPRCDSPCSTHPIPRLSDCYLWGWGEARIGSSPDCHGYLFPQGPPPHLIPPPGSLRALQRTPNSSPAATGWCVVRSRRKWGDRWLDRQHHHFKKEAGSPGRFGSVDRASACRLKGPRFDSGQGVGLWARSPVRGLQEAADQ